MIYRAVLAKSFGCTPADIRACTNDEVAAMWWLVEQIEREAGRG